MLGCYICTADRSDRSDQVQELATDDIDDSPHVPLASSHNPEHVPTSLPALTLPNNLASHPIHELLTDDQQCNATVSTSPSPTQEHIPASPPAPPDNPSSHMQLPTDDQQYASATSTLSSSTHEHIPALQCPLRILTPGDKLHPTLCCWIKNMNKLSSLIDRLQELASSAPPEHRFQLSNQVVALRATPKKQKEHFMEFLQLSEEYANKYLLDVSAEIQQQSSFLDRLKERLEAAEKLRGEAVDLQKLYESGTVAAMKNFRATGMAVSCRLQKQILRLLFQHFRGHFQRTTPCSAKWSCC
jgi:hypothetical protein